MDKSHWLWGLSDVEACDWHVHTCLAHCYELVAGRLRAAANEQASAVAPLAATSVAVSKLGCCAHINVATLLTAVAAAC